MKNKMKVETSKLTNIIFAGEIKRPGEWKAGKQDVTLDCLIAVAEHVKNFGEPVGIFDVDTGEMIFKITVEQGKKDTENSNKT